MKSWLFNFLIGFSLLISAFGQIADGIYSISPKICKRKIAAMGKNGIELNNPFVTAKKNVNDLNQRFIFQGVGNGNYVISPETAKGTTWYCTSPFPDYDYPINLDNYGGSVYSPQHWKLHPEGDCFIIESDYFQGRVWQVMSIENEYFSGQGIVHQEPNGLSNQVFCLKFLEPLEN